MYETFFQFFNAFSDISFFYNPFSSPYIGSTVILLLLYTIYFYNCKLITANMFGLHIFLFVYCWKILNRVYPNAYHTLIGFEVLKVFITFKTADLLKKIDFKCAPCSNIQFMMRYILIMLLFCQYICICFFIHL